LVDELTAPRPGLSAVTAAQRHAGAARPLAARGSPQAHVGFARIRRASARPISAAEIAQARLFADTLQSEIAELQELAATIEARWANRREQRRQDELRRVRARVNEVRRLLDALRDRFPPT
jgi:hypothetical protein